MAHDIIADHAKLDCVQRELKMRRRVYARWVDEGRMQQSRADTEIMVMEAIAADYQARIEAGRLL